MCRENCRVDVSMTSKYSMRITPLPLNWAIEIFNVYKRSYCQIRLKYLKHVMPLPSNQTIKSKKIFFFFVVLLLIGLLLSTQLRRISQNR